MKKTKLFLAVLSALLIVFSLVKTVVPQTATAEGLTVAPAFLSVSLTKKEPEKTEAIAVKNDFSVAVNIEASIRGVSVETGQLVPTDQIDPGLKATAEIVNPKFSLAPGDSVNLQIKFKDNPALTGGGHYLSVFIRQTSVSAGQGQVGLQPAISVLTFITKEEGAKRELAITKINPLKSLFSLPSYVDLTFKNLGNVHLIPRAAVIVSDTSGQTKYASGVANEQSSPVLPGKELRLRVPLDKNSNPWLPTKYQVSVQYRFDGAPSSRRVAAEYWYVPFGYLLPLILLIPWLYYTYKNYRKQASLNKVSKMVVRPRKARKKTGKKPAKKPAKSDTQKA